MKRFITLLLLAIIIGTAGAAKQKELSTPIALKGELKKAYNNIPENTPITIRRVVKMTPIKQHHSGIYYATEVNEQQIAFPAEKLDIITFSPPKTSSEFWQQVYIKSHLYEYFYDKGYQQKLRREVNEECQ